MWRVTWIKACGGNKVVWAGYSSACVQPHPGQSRTYQRTEWSRCCPCGSSPLPAALDASSGVSAPVVAAPKCAELSSRSPPTSARKKERKRRASWTAPNLLLCMCPQQLISYWNTQLLTHSATAAVNKLPSSQRLGEWCMRTSTHLDVIFGLHQQAEGGVPVSIWSQGNEGFQALQTQS